MDSRKVNKYLCLYILIVLAFIKGALEFAILHIISMLKSLIMTDNPKKKKKNARPKTNLTVAQRNVIDANWQLLLSSNLFKKSAKSEDNENHYTGPFRRARKKNLLNSTIPSKNEIKINSPDSKKNFEQQPAKMDNNLQLKDNKFNKTYTKFIALDCEMVGIGSDGRDNMLARVSIVNKFGDCIYDKFVKPREQVIDYRTEVSGVRREDLLNGEEFSVVQREVADLLKGRILVGHSLKNDFEVLFLSHPKKCIRDTSKYKPFKQITRGNTPSLKRLTKEILGVEIQKGEHNSIEDARAVMKLYCSVAKKWEMTITQKRGGSSKICEE